MACADRTEPAVRAGRRNCRTSPGPATPVRPAPLPPAGAAGRWPRPAPRRTRRPARAGNRAPPAHAHSAAHCSPNQQRSPERDVPTRQQRDRRGAHRRARSCAPDVSRAQAMRPARHMSSSHAGSYPAMRAGRSSVSHALAGASKPSSKATAAGIASGPSSRASSVTRCQSNRKRRKSRAATGSISARRRRTV